MLISCMALLRTAICLRPLLHGSKSAEGVPVLALVPCTLARVSPHNGTATRPASYYLARVDHANARSQSYAYSSCSSPLACIPNGLWWETQA